MNSQLHQLADQSHQQQVRRATERPSFDHHVPDRPALLPLFAAALAKRYPDSPTSAASAPRVTTA